MRSQPHVRVVMAVALDLFLDAASHAIDQAIEGGRALSLAHFFISTLSPFSKA